MVRRDKNVLHFKQYFFLRRVYFYNTTYKYNLRLNTIKYVIVNFCIKPQLQVTELIL